MRMISSSPRYLTLLLATGPLAGQPTSLHFTPLHSTPLHPTPLECATCTALDGPASNFSLTDALPCHHHVSCCWKKKRRRKRERKNAWGETRRESQSQIPCFIFPSLLLHETRMLVMIRIPSSVESKLIICFIAHYYHLLTEMLLIERFFGIPQSS